ncbi:MAG: PEP-CTERM sorting domain-containing protein [Opitutus sp.]|nr:PEP-CTERM sorting domain-containing protein [Opitutus sp.]
MANYTGLMDEVVLYSGALTVGEVQQLAAIPEPGATAVLVTLVVLVSGAWKLRRRRGAGSL